MRYQCIVCEGDTDGSLICEACQFAGDSPDLPELEEEQ